jgi:phosphatidylglycerol---prolipoprotein diacylglyceryl transferase
MLGRLLLIIVAVGLPLWAAPYINYRGVVNGASFAPQGLPHGSIARGSIFTIFGRDLGPQTFVTPSESPLQTTLGGVLVTVTQGETTFDANPIFAWNSQLSVIMPSQAKPGPAVIPYFPQPSLELGPVTIHAFGVLTVTAALVGLVLTKWRVSRMGLDAVIASRMWQLMLLSGFAGAWVARILVYAPGTFKGFSSFGGLVLGLVAAVVYLRSQRVSVVAYLDAVAFVFPWAWMIGRLGCTLAHDHPGIESSHWLAVDYPGGPRFNLGLLELLFVIGVGLLFVALDRRQRWCGFYLTAFLLVYGSFRIALDLLHETRPEHLGLGADQWGGLGAVAAGIVVWVSVRVVNERQVCQN